MRDLPAVLSSRRGTARRFQRGRVTATGTLLSVKLDDTAEAIKLPVLTGTTLSLIHI